MTLEKLAGERAMKAMRLLVAINNTTDKEELKTVADKLKYETGILRLQSLEWRMAERR